MPSTTSRRRIPWYTRGLVLGERDDEGKPMIPMVLRIARFRVRRELDEPHDEDDQLAEQIQDQAAAIETRGPGRVGS